MVGLEIWAFLFLLGILAFNWPLLEIFSLSLPYYLFGAWGIFILAVGRMIASRRRKGSRDV